MTPRFNKLNGTERAFHLVQWVAYVSQSLIAFGKQITQSQLPANTPPLVKLCLESKSMTFERWRRLLPRRKPPPERARVRRLAKIINELLIPAIHGGAVDTIEPVIRQLTEAELSTLEPSTVMGIARLFLYAGLPQATEDLIFRYLGSRRRSHMMIYFLEPISELDRMGTLTNAPLREFFAQFKPVSSIRVIDWLNEEYQSADEADYRNFQCFVLMPLRALSAQAGNLMDIRFSTEQRAALREIIRKSLAERRPLSLLRLGDGEAFAYPPPEVEGIPSAVLESDDENFKRSYFRSKGLPADNYGRLIKDFRQAVARCDILGIPSIYRIVRNLSEPGSRYGMRRNQRAFIRILGAVGASIPLEQKIVTEERCHRVREALDEPFLLELASQAESVVLVSRWPEIQGKFPTKSSLIVVPSKKRVLYQCYPEIAERVCAISGPGTFVVIGAGVPAKIIADRARQSGAVALDVGSLMDYMIGQKTRTIADLT